MMESVPKINDAIHLEKSPCATSSNGHSAHDVQRHNSGSAIKDWTDSEEKALVRRIDFKVFPMLSILFALSFLDRGNVSAAYIAGLAKDVGLAVGSRYSVVLLVFFIGYALFELPSNYVIRRIGARWWLATLVFVWGTSVFAMGFIHSWQALAGLRALLGVFEAGLYPGSVYLIASWYRQYETGKRISFFYLSGLIATAFGPIFAYALSLIRVGDGDYRQGWRWIFIIEGTVTMVVGLIAPAFLPEFPETARFLNDREKHIALTRVHLNQAKQQFEHATIRQSLRMLLDWKILVFGLQYFVAATSVYALGYFQPLILRNGLGFSYTKAQLMSSPPIIFAIVMSLITSTVSDKIKLRWPVICGQCIIAVIGYLIMLYARPAGARYFGIFLATYGAQANAPLFLAYGQNQTPQLAKRGVVAAATISIGAVGGVCGSTIFRAQDAPRYLPGIWTTIVLQLLTAVVTLCTSMWFKRQNKRADEGVIGVLEGVEGFRYAP